MNPPKEYQFKPGQSGNPSGRPKNTLKDFVRQQFMEMTAQEKGIFLKGISKEMQWKMGEGNPAQEQQISGNVTVNLVDLYGDKDSA